MEPVYPNFFIEIKKNDDGRLPRKYTDFTILEHNVNGSALQILVEYNSVEDPGIDALWNEEKKFLYLVGGKRDRAKIETDAKGDWDITLAKANKAWITLDLSSIEASQGAVDVKGRTARKYEGEGGDLYLIETGHDIHLMTISFN